MIAFNKIANALRRLDEAEPENTLMNPAEIVRGGFSAQRSRMQRAAKSVRKTEAIVKSSRRIRLA
jgi:hypothetical protein